MEACKTKFVPKLIKQMNEKAVRNSMKVIDDYKIQLKKETDEEKKKELKKKKKFWKKRNGFWWRWYRQKSCHPERSPYSDAVEGSTHYYRSFYDYS